MGDICYTCKKKLGWTDKKYRKRDMVVMVHGAKKTPTGFTDKDRMCEFCAGTWKRCVEQDRKKQAERDSLAAKLALGVGSVAAPRVKCHWCKKQKIHNQFATRIASHDTCYDCDTIISGLTTKKLAELISLQNANNRKIWEIKRLIGEADKAISLARSRKYADIFSGTASIIPTSNTQYAENSANQNKGSLKLNLLDAEQESTRIKNLIQDEKIVLANKHFFNLDSNESETKVNSTNTIKTNEHDDPVKILKIRLAKGEITIEEFNKIKENLAKIDGSSTRDNEKLIISKEAKVSTSDNNLDKKISQQDTQKFLSTATQLENSIRRIENSWQELPSNVDLKKPHNWNESKETIQKYKKWLSDDEPTKRKFCEIFGISPTIENYNEKIKHLKRFFQTLTIETLAITADFMDKYFDSEPKNDASDAKTESIPFRRKSELEKR